MEEANFLSKHPIQKDPAHIYEQEKQKTEFAKDPEAFWRRQADRLSWYKKPTIIQNVSFHHPVSVKWYEDGKLNLSYNCIDRHLPTKGLDTALIWEPDEPQMPSQRISYQKLSDEVNAVASVLKAKGIGKGDFVTIYMPMVPQAAYAMLACSRIGAVHNVVFGGFAPDSIVDRVHDCDSKWIITCSQGARAGKKINLMENVDIALKKLSADVQVLLFDYDCCVGKNQTVIPISKKNWHQMETELAMGKGFCEPEKMNAEDPLFILYTSGSTNKPKGVLHTTGGYSVYASYTHQTVFDYKSGEIYWCTADVGWVTGHSYLVYGPLLNGATTLMFEGVPTYPTASRFWEVVDKHQVNIFYTAPTALRALMKEGEDFVRKASRKSLRVLGSVGEPINPEAWRWYYEVVGEGKCPIVDTWWQTETGGILISPVPFVTPLKPGSATLPLVGIQPEILTPEGQKLEGACEGVLVLKNSWPGQARTVYKNHSRFEETYFSTYPGYYFTGDGCRRDEDGFYWITGRVDDVLNVSGHRLGTAEIESSLVGHQAVAEAAVVGYPHEIKGQGIYVYVTLKNGVAPSDSLKKELATWVRGDIGPIATPDVLQWAPGLPKTRSGKIMRRILRKIAEGNDQQLGDTSTLADPSVVDQLVQGSRELKKN